MPNQALDLVITLLLNSVCSQKNENMDEKLTAYCSLYCADCIPSREELFALVNHLDQIFEKLQFDQYAKFKSA